jgi:hypothetical protein
MNCGSGSCTSSAAISETGAGGGGGGWARSVRNQRGYHERAHRRRRWCNVRFQFQFRLRLGLWFWLTCRRGTSRCRGWRGSWRSRLSSVASISSGKGTLGKTIPLPNQPLPLAPRYSLIWGSKLQLESRLQLQLPSQPQLRSVLSI